MVERRTLIEGMKNGAPPPAGAGDPSKERQFVYGTDAAKPEVRLERQPLNTKIRSDYAKALRRVSLERQLNGTEPSTLQEILEEALEPWMRSTGLSR